MSDPMATPLPEPRRRPLVADVPKRNRTRLAKAELLAMLAAHCIVTAGEAPTRVADPDDGLRDLCQRYGLGQEDIARILSSLATELANSADRRGYQDAWR